MCTHCPTQQPPAAPFAFGAFVIVTPAIEGFSEWRGTVVHDYGDGIEISNDAGFWTRIDRANVRPAKRAPSYVYEPGDDMTPLAPGANVLHAHTPTNAVLAGIVLECRGDERYAVALSDHSPHGWTVATIHRARLAVREPIERHPTDDPRD